MIKAIHSEKCTAIKGNLTKKRSNTYIFQKFNNLIFLI